MAPVRLIEDLAGGVFCGIELLPDPFQADVRRSGDPDVNRVIIFRKDNL